ncbi:hypothetical protein [Legionella brunensis]|uniref:Uncharacterized protein n=1 Tax=Legionella brunensis TaxID=29422 RepID=A0A0W0SNT3_9GAMM|nr:hypothetical protein [Legionella brunensis]KTC85046.1 hypothetical protein Lbru_1261 [Legionella brunensis]
MPKYLMLDHGGVLDGAVLDDISTINENDDLVLEYFDWGGAQVLKNGVNIVGTINRLVKHYGYEVVFHSKNIEDDQIKILKQLQQACIEKGLKFPEVHAMAVYDKKRYENHSSDAPAKILRQDGILFAGWGKDDLNGKASVRRALEQLLGIREEDRRNHIVFDDGKPNVDTPIEEGYQAYLIGKEQGQKTLDEALEEVILEAKFEAKQEVDETVGKPSQHQVKENSASVKSSEIPAAPLEQLRKDLIKKIDDYLEWRENKDSDDGRGYKLGLFTKLRHYTEFGKLRAENLRTTLSTANSENLIATLQQHLQMDSKLNNHSLDTYLLEAVAQHATLFNIMKDINLGGKKGREELRELVQDYPAKVSMNSSFI